jgi:hypothetical protein
MKLGALTLGAYRLIFVISFWCISPFVCMKCPSLLHLIIVSLKSILFDISIASLLVFFRAIVLVNLSPAFHPKPVFVSVDEIDLLQTTDC